MQSPIHYQVITGVSPFDGIHDYDTLTSYIRSGERPPRPRNQNASKWLRGGVWNMITTGWSEDPKKRWEVLAVCELFSTLCPREAHTANPGNRNTQSTGNAEVTNRFWVLK